MKQKKNIEITILRSTKLKKTNKIFKLNFKIYNKTIKL